MYGSEEIRNLTFVTDILMINLVSCLFAQFWETLCHNDLTKCLQVDTEFDLETWSHYPILVFMSEHICQSRYTKFDLHLATWSCFFVQLRESLLVSPSHKDDPCQVWLKSKLLKIYGWLRPKKKTNPVFKPRKFGNWPILWQDIQSFAMHIASFHVEFERNIHGFAEQINTWDTQTEHYCLYILKCTANTKTDSPIF